MRKNNNLSSQVLDYGLSWKCEELNHDIAHSLQADWNDLSDAMSEENYFFDPHYIINSLPLLKKYKPKILTIRDNKQLIGLTILRTDIGYGKLPWPFWRSAMHFEQYLGTPIVRNGKENEFATALCKWLDKAPFHCSFLNIAMLSLDSDVSRAIQNHCHQEKRLFLRANSYKRAAILTLKHHDIDPEKLISSNRRKSLRRNMNKLSKLGDVTIERLIKECDLESWISHFLALENTGWKHEKGSSILSCENETRLYKQIIIEAFHRENLIFSRLCLDGKAIAYTLDIASGSRCYCLKSAIDQEYRKYSPGVLMEFETLKYYLDQNHYTYLDSCTAPDNDMLNALWPDRIAISDLVIERKGFIYAMIFRIVRAIKSNNHVI